MSDIQEQLAILKRRIARIDKRFAKVDPAPPQWPPEFRSKAAESFIEEWQSGQEVETPHGRHFETEKLWESHRRHGSVDISSLMELPHDLLKEISAGEHPSSAPSHWAFLDTETTGLAGGSGTYAFLIGVGRITSEGFRLRQFFMRDPGEEASVLHALTEHLAEFDTLITYNGKSYDQPLLETRYRMARSRPPFSRLVHLDLLFGSRRLWKLRYDSCRLVELENQVLGVERQGDLPGAMIPYVYFEYLRSREAFRVMPILHHNAIDILTLACLTAIVPWAFKSPHEAALAHGAEMVGLARWLRRGERHEDALLLMRRGIQKGLPDDLLFRTLWDIASLEKKLGREEAAMETFLELAGCRNQHRVAALEELAKHHEHRRRNYTLALEFTLSALQHADTPELRRRQVRLERRVSVKRSAKLSLG